MTTALSYTLQPVPYELSAQEQQDAQYAMSVANAKISNKVWLILAAVCAGAVAGIVLLHGYSTAFFWIILVFAALYVLVRIFGVAWYIKREMKKVPTQDIKGIKLGVQPQGIIMIQGSGVQMGRGFIDWKQVTEWRETAKFIYLTYTAKGQTGAMILPKRMTAQKFPIETVRHHLLDAVGPAAK